MTHVNLARRPVLELALGAVLLAGCAGPDAVVAPNATPPAHPSLAAAAAGRVVRVRPGESIQAAVDAAGAGGTVQIEPGEYAEAVTVAVPNLRIMGLGNPGDVVLRNPGSATNGIRVTTAGDGFDLDNITVRGFEANGVLLVRVDGFRLSRVRTENNGEYGLFPVLSSHGVIDGCTATGHADTGIYVGQSSDVEIRNSVAWGNVAGFELENTTRASLTNSEAYDNTVGILVSLVPPAPYISVLTATDNLVAHNRVHDNNHANFGEEGDLAALLPAGTGILVVGPDRTTIEHNTVTNNVSSGIAVVDAAVLALLSGDADAYGTLNTAPDGTRVQLNTVLGNGTAPQPPLNEFFPGVDLLWDGSGVGNCWWQNRYGTSFPDPLPACK
ncbi:parallel beta-helix repeat-containing protein [Gemmatirosa kalamazoonensis]|uniref:Parallel beta-helix repeat-containing protein n=1 Tax=Gemmatirosa kalamazoonensis TaxID=861299 RepID=W0RCD8_9BACT|nr:parallel beta-helix domain-containing protein [Gemmatirosa kalamazoonensis]AHG88112.1 parallel beta-helix repeat-containing protein [Gemmatirosa kalamazoonensis]